MKKIITIALCAVVVLPPFTGCQKIIDHIFNRDKTVVSTCRIAKILSVDEFSGETHTGIVYYNDHNDPDSVIFNFEGSTVGIPLFYFKYDDQHRLIEYRANYSNAPDDYFDWHIYVYEDGVVVRDTTRAHVSGQTTEVGNVEYDANGRIVKVTSHIIEIDHAPADEEREPVIYKYDASGNLNGDIFEYDNKINFRRTNKVWMFSQRNYSMNNVVGASVYNEHGLPIAFEDDKRPHFLVPGVTSIEYECGVK